MKTFNTLLAAMAVCAAGITTAQAADDNFASLTYGQTSDKVRKSGLLQRNTQLNSRWHHRQGRHLGCASGQDQRPGPLLHDYDNVSGDHSGLKLRQENLLGSYDLFLPVGDTTSCSAVAAWA
jgi:hypothetical protein